MSEHIHQWRSFGHLSGVKSGYRYMCVTCQAQHVVWVDRTTLEVEDPLPLGVFWKPPWWKLWHKHRWPEPASRGWLKRRRKSTPWRRYWWQLWRKYRR